MNQEKFSNKPPGVGEQKALANVKDASCSLIMGSPTEEWGELPPTGLMLCQTSTQEVPQTEPINNIMKKGDARIMHMGDTILSAEAEAGIDENWCLLYNQSTCNAFINKNTSQISEMLPMENIYMSIVTQEWHTPTKLVTSLYIPIMYSITPR